MAMSDLDPSLSLKSSSSKTPMIVVGLLVAGAIGYFAYSSMKEQSNRKIHAQVMESFQQIEHNEVGPFWECVLGPNVDPASFPSNLEFAARLESAFAMDTKTYPQKVSQECAPKALEAKHRVGTINAPPEYSEAIKKYEESLSALATELEAWSKIAPAHVAEREVGKKMDQDADAYHAWDGSKPSPEVMAYDAFLHCAAPALDRMKDGQALVEYLFEQCKSGAFTTRLENECGKNLTTPPIVPSPGLKAGFKNADGREKDALGDCLRKNRKGKRQDDSAGLQRAWKDYLDAGAGVKKIGKDALKSS